MRPIITNYPQGRGLYALRMNPDLSRFASISLVDWRTYNSNNYADHALIMTDPFNLGVYGVLPPAMTLSDIPIDIIKERVSDGIGGFLAAAPTDACVGIDTSGEGVNILGVNGLVQSAKNLSASAGTIVIGAALTGTLTATEVTTNLTVALDTAYTGRVLVWTSGALKDAAFVINGYDGTLKKLTLQKMPLVPVNGDTFVIL